MLLSGSQIRDILKGVFDLKSNKTGFYCKLHRRYVALFPVLFEDIFTDINNCQLVLVEQFKSVPKI